MKELKGIYESEKAIEGKLEALASAKVTGKKVLEISKNKRHKLTEFTLNNSQTVLVTTEKNKDYGLFLVYQIEVMN